VTDHEILGVEPSATPKEIREAYVFLAGRFHPDANPGREDKAAEHFRKVQEAYERLSHPETANSARAQPRPTAPPPPTPAKATPRAPGADNEPMDDFLKTARPKASPQAPTADNCSMDAFIDLVVADYQPDKGKAFAKSLGMTLLKTGVLNALTLPFGRVSFGISRYKPLTKEQYKARLRASLYPKTLETKHGKSAEWFRKMISSYDRASPAAKAQILGLAIKEPDKYMEWVLVNHR
jgi:hypothetical protein